MVFLYTARFIRSLKKVPKSVLDDAFYAIKEFEDRNNHKRLSLHKLKGRLSRLYSFRVNYSYRIVIKLDKNKVYFMDIGTHDVYK